MADLEIRQLHEDLLQTNALLTELINLLRGDGDQLAIIQTVTDEDGEVVTKE